MLPGNRTPLRGAGFRFLLAPAIALAAGLFPPPAAAQLGGLEGLARRINSANFYVSHGGLAPDRDDISERGRGLRAFGVETLIEIRTVTRPIPGTSTERDTANVRWTAMEIVRRQGQADTIYHYEVETVTASPRSEDLWLFELGLGYGQVSGFKSGRADLDLRGSVRDLPAVSLYATYEPRNLYFGVRSGFMKLHNFQVYDEAGEVYEGKAESFLAGGVFGYAPEWRDMIPFVEFGYTIRDFPSIDWSEDVVPPGIPRDLSVSGWSIGVGIQFSVGED